MSLAQFSRKIFQPARNDSGPDAALAAIPAINPANDVLPEAEVREALERILSDNRLRLSDRNRRFLRFVVEEKLAGRSERIKSYTVAVDVFGRAPTFDSVTDPIVRIEATRLRAGLASYYEAAGAEDPVRIELPRGSYVPIFRRTNTAAESVLPPASQEARRSGRFSDRATVLASVGLIIICVAAAAMIKAIEVGSFDPQAGTPVIVVESVRGLSEDNPETHELAQGLTQSIVSGLSRFPSIRLVYVQEGRASTDMADGAKDVPLYVLQSNLRVSKDSLRFWWSVVDGRTEETLWSENIDQSRYGELANTIEDRIAARVAARIAEPYGIIGAAGPSATGSTGPGYDCVLQARAQLAAPDPARHKRIRHCLEQTVAFAPQYGDAWALLALAYLYEERPLNRNRPAKRDLTAMAREAAERATQLAPHSGLAYQALLVSHFRLGDFAAADEAAKRALELNPNDPEILHAAGLRAYVRGRREEGLAQIEKSRILATRIRPSTQFVLALEAYREGEYWEALNLLQPVEQSPVALIHVLRAASQAQLNDTKAAKQTIAKLLKTRPDYARELRLDLAAVHYDEELTRIVVAGARRAGLAVE